jgi:hypothetical protein
VFALAVVLGWLAWSGDGGTAHEATPVAAVTKAADRLADPAGPRLGPVPGTDAGASQAAAPALSSSRLADLPSADLSSLETDFPIVAPLNRRDSTIARDLETLAHVLEAWRSNFPREGNPVGENADITAALAGDNRLGFVLIPRNHPAINSAGELCDRWGTPFRFHQVSGQDMEIRSAGPDRIFATADDAEWNPLP